MKKILLLILIISSPVFAGSVSFLPKEDPNSLSIPSGKVIVGNSSGYGEAVTVGGDITINSSGTATIAAGSVEASMLAAGAVSTDLAVGQAIGCGLSVSGGGTLSIVYRDGTSLSTSNICKIGIASSTSGQVNIAQFTSDITVTPKIDGNLFGIAEANWANVMPMFIGVVSDITSGGTNHKFILSRVPMAKTGAAVADVCQLGDVSCDSFKDVMFLSSGMTLKDWLSQTITQVGWVQASYATTGTDWTFALTDDTGFNFNYEAANFTFPMGQMGTSAGKYILENSNTAPVFTTNFYKYSIDRQCNATVQIALGGDGGTDGVGTVDANIVMPYYWAHNSTVLGAAYSYSGFASGSGITSNYNMIAHVYDNSLTPTFRAGKLDSNPATLANFGNGNRNINFHFKYKTYCNLDL